MSNAAQPRPTESPILDEYLRRTPKSAAHQARAEKAVPGGNSRGAAHWFPHPITVERAEGAFLHDLDGHRYVDLTCNYTSLVHGHRFPPIMRAVEEQLRRGTAWAANNTAQAELAEAIVSRVRAVERIRFTNSGTEAGNLALLIARVRTGRHKVLMARYGYHGQLLEFEVGSFYGFMSAKEETTYAEPYNDAAAFERVLEERGSEIAAVFLEPVMGSGGMVSATREFLSRVQAAARRAGALFVLDEVITFRLGTGGLQASLGIEPDLTMFGKLIGGGFPVGAVGGPAELMAALDPKSLKLFHSGTYNGNPVTMAAGTVSVRELTAERIQTMEALGARLETRLVAAARKLGLPFSVNRAGSLLNVFFTAKSPAATIVREDQAAIGLFHIAAMNHGIFPAARGMIVLSTITDEAMADEIADRAADAMRDVAAEMP